MLLRQIYEQKLIEAQLSDITIGFEVECVIDGDMTKVYSDVAKKYNVEGGSDSSIEPNTVYGNEIGMEFRIGELAEGGQMTATPQNITTCANFVHDILVAGSRIVKLSIALAAIKNTASSNSSQKAVLLV